MSLAFTVFYVTEGSGVYTNAGKVQISGQIKNDLTIALTNDAPTRILTPASVTIPAGQTSVMFNVTVPGDPLTQGNQLVIITASADGLFPAAQNLFVVDDDIYNFGFAGMPAVAIGGQSFPVTVYAQNYSGSPIPGYSASVNLKATNAGGTVAVSPAVIGPFVDGVWSGNITVAGGLSNVVLTAFDNLGHSGTSDPFETAAGSGLALLTSDIAYDPIGGLLWAGIQSGVNSQAVVSINPASGAVSAPIPLGSAPGRLALSDDGQFLYVGLMTTGGVARINLGSRSVDLRFALEAGGNTFATEMAVPPGDPHALVVQRDGGGTGAKRPYGKCRSTATSRAATAHRSLSSAWRVPFAITRATSMTPSWAPAPR